MHLLHILMHRAVLYLIIVSETEGNKSEGNNLETDKKEDPVIEPGAITGIDN